MDILRRNLHCCAHLLLDISTTVLVFLCFITFYLSCLQFFYHGTISFLMYFCNYYIMGQASSDQRGRLMMTSERLNQSSDRIRESQRTVFETEEIGVSILQDLHNQRQSLLHAHTTVCTLFSQVDLFGTLSHRWS